MLYIARWTLRPTRDEPLWSVPRYGTPIDLRAPDGSGVNAAWLWLKKPCSHPDLMPVAATLDEHLSHNAIARIAKRLDFPLSERTPRALIAESLMRGPLEKSGQWCLPLEPDYRYQARVIWLGNRIIWNELAVVPAHSSQLVETWPTIGTYTNGNNTTGQTNTWTVQGVDGATLHPSVTTIAGTPNQIGPTATETGLKNELLGPTLTTTDHYFVATFHLIDTDNLTHSMRIGIRVTDTNNYYYVQSSRSGNSGYLRNIIRNVSGTGTNIFQDTTDPGANAITQAIVAGSSIAGRWALFGTNATDTNITTGSKVLWRTGPDGSVVTTECTGHSMRFGDITARATGIPAPWSLK